MKSASFFITKPFLSSPSVVKMQALTFLPKPCISSPSFVKMQVSHFVAKTTFSSSFITKPLMSSSFITKSLFPSSSLLPLTSSSSPFLPIKCSRNDRLETREKAELATLQKRIHREVLKNKMDKAILIYDNWKAKRVPLFEDGKTSREIVGMSKGAFVAYVWGKFFGKPSEREKKNRFGSKKKMMIKKPKKVGFPVKRKKVVKTEVVKKN